MSTLVVDASVFAKLYLPEPDSPRADRALRGRSDLAAPDLLWAELANVLWKQCTRGGIDPRRARELMREARMFPLQTHPCAELAEHATALALETGRSAYDCVYIALAIRERGELLTADERLVNALRGGPLAGIVKMLAR